MTQALRLASNLILARLLFPEAFGIMALVSVVLIGLTMFSDVGLGPAIAQSKRGDDPVFLNTAFSLNVARGGLLWLLTILAAVPMARLYEAPELTELLPVAGLALFVSGFTPIRLETANRHLLLGRVTFLDIISNVVGVLAMISLALVYRSVWALVFGTVFGALVRVILMRFFLPGAPSKLHWDWPAASELVHFGKWIFLSTVCGFLLSQGDKAIFGRFLTLEELGTYSIGYFLASFPLLLAGSVVGKIMIPIYRDRHPAASPANASQLRKMRFLISGGSLALLVIMGVFGPLLVALLYDGRYETAGEVVVAVALLQVPIVVGLTYDQVALAAGDSKSYFLLLALKAAVQTTVILIGIQQSGLFGALAAQGFALVALHLPIMLLAHKHRAWDWVHDVIFGLAGLVAAALIVFVHY